MTGLSPPQRERTDNVYDGTGGLLHDGLLAGLDGLESYDLAGVDVRVRAQVSALVSVARELCDACADLADALRPLPGNGMDDPLTMDFARLRAERSAALLDEAASAARGTYRLLEGAYAALDVPGEQPAGRVPGTAGGAAAAQPTAAEGAAAGGAAAEARLSPPPPAPVWTEPAAAPTEPAGAEVEPVAGFARAGFETAPPFELPSREWATGFVPAGLEPAEPFVLPDLGVLDEPAEPGRGPDLDSHDAGWATPARPVTPLTPPEPDEPGEPGLPPATEAADASWTATPWPPTPLTPPEPGEPGLPPATEAADASWTATPWPPGERRPETAAPGEPTPAAEPATSDAGWAGPAETADLAPHPAEPGTAAESETTGVGWAAPPQPPDLAAEPGTAAESETTGVGWAAPPQPTPDPGAAPAEPGGVGSAAEPPTSAVGWATEPAADLGGDAPEPAGFATAVTSWAPESVPGPDFDLGGFEQTAPFDPPTAPAAAGGIETPASVETATGFEPPRLEPAVAEFWDEAIEPAAGEAEDAEAASEAPAEEFPAEEAPAEGFPTVEFPAGQFGTSEPVLEAASAPLPTPRDSTWPDAFVELPPRASEPEFPAATAPAEAAGGGTEPGDQGQWRARRTAATGRHTPPALAVVPNAEQPAPARTEYPDQAGLAALARQVEGARRHLQAAVLVAYDTAGHPRLNGLLGAVEQVLAAATKLAQESRETLAAEVADRTFPGEARFLCAVPWERTPTVAADPSVADQATPSGLARLLASLGYDAQPVTASTGVVGVQVRSDRYAAHIALVEPAGGGRQRWSGALEWTDAAGASRTWAETLGPVELDEHELAHRVDDLLRRYVGPLV